MKILWAMIWAMTALLILALIVSGGIYLITASLAGDRVSPPREDHGVFGMSGGRLRGRDLPRCRPRAGTHGRTDDGLPQSGVQGQHVPRRGPPNLALPVSQDVEPERVVDRRPVPVHSRDDRYRALRQIGAAT